MQSLICLDSWWFVVSLTLSNLVWCFRLLFVTCCIFFRIMFHYLSSSGFSFCCALLRHLPFRFSMSSTLAWMASIVTINEMRAGPQFELKKSPQGVCSDGKKATITNLFLDLLCSIMYIYCYAVNRSFSLPPSLPPFILMKLHSLFCLPFDRLFPWCCLWYYYPCFFVLFFFSGFLVNFCAVMLEFCKPFFSNHPSAKKLPLIVPQYPSSPFCRLDLHNEPCLAGGIISEWRDGREKEKE